MAARAHPRVIDLVGSSSDDEPDTLPRASPMPRHRPIQIEDSEDDDAIGGAPLAPPMAGAFPPEHLDEETPLADPVVRERHVHGGMIIVIDDEEVFIPEEEPQGAAHVQPTATLDGRGTDDLFTVDECLQQILEIFPDICHDHVRSLWDKFDQESDFEILRGRARLDNIVEQLVSSTSYPKHVKGKLKRKREDSVGGPLDVKKWDPASRAAVPNWVKGSIAAICKADFPMIPRNHINERLTTHGFLFQTYAALAKDVDDTEDGAHVFGKGRAAKNTTAAADTIALNCGYVELVAELAAARLHVAANRMQREAVKAKKRAEEENLQKAIAAGETAECSACFDDLPMNRQIRCDGDTAHFTCFDCAETYIKSEVGESRCKVLCPAGCGAGFSHSQLHLLGNKKLLEKLAQIQQEQDIRDAGLEDLESCPFCDFKAILPPIEEDFEFRCANPECEQVSCRRCKAISHIPISCEQHAKDNKLSSRHQIEEAMTAALVRQCVKCKKQFIKESGCNKMSCGSCGTLQCYVCSAIIKDYNHFDQGSYRGRTLDGANGKCPLYDNVEERHEREVREAEAKARAEVVENNPDVSAEDLEINVSEAVKKAETDRIQRGAAGNVGAGALMGAYLGHRAMLRRFEDDDLLGGAAAEDALEDMLGLFPGARPRAERRPDRPAGDANAAPRANYQQRLRELEEQHARRRAAARVGVGNANQRQGPDYAARLRELEQQHQLLYRRANNGAGAARHFHYAVPRGRRGAAGAQDREPGQDPAAPNPFYAGPDDDRQAGQALQGYIPVQIVPNRRQNNNGNAYAQQAPPPPVPAFGAFDAPDYMPGLLDGLFDGAPQQPANGNPYQLGHRDHHPNGQGHDRTGNAGQYAQPRAIPGAFPEALPPTQPDPPAQDDDRRHNINDLRRRHFELRQQVMNAQRQGLAIDGLRQQRDALRRDLVDAQRDEQRGYRLPGQGFLGMTGGGDRQRRPY